MFIEADFIVMVGRKYTNIQTIKIYGQIIRNDNKQSYVRKENGKNTGIPTDTSEAMSGVKYKLAKIYEFNRERYEGTYGEWGILV